MNLPGLKRWVYQSSLNSHLRTRKIPFLQSREWVYADAEIKHLSNRFFKVIAVEWQNKKRIQQQLLLDQREIGTLGFILRRGRRGNAILLQAKVEPGNVGLAQIAPTCQATLSNLDQVHGGTPPPFAHFFTTGTKEILSCSLQSEQGTRFFGKRNNNMIVVGRTKISTPPNFKWTDTRLICQAMCQNYLVNTDARSVLVSSDWQKLVIGDIFNKKDRFINELYKSYYSNAQVISINNVLNRLGKYSTGSPQVKIIPISKVRRRLNDNSDFRLIHIVVNTKGREVERWDQPIVKSNTNGYYILYCGRADGILYFCFEFWEEPGLYNHVELGPHKSRLREGKVIVSCWQSDEGGRFYRDKSKYSLVDIGPIESFRADLVWLSLKQVQELCMREGIFCNEARSAISLILSMI